MKLKKMFSLAVVLLCAVMAMTGSAAAAQMKAVWISTYLNIDWPSKPGLDVQTQIAQLDNLMKVAKAAGLNTVILQVRSEYDAIYPSKYEPWSRVLTGKSGGDPGYDPLATAIQLAHSKGLKLHAWVNPYRAGMTKNSYAKKHITNTMPGAVRTYGKYYWCDPSESGPRKQTLAVIADIVSRYDIDGLHYDDYFYPYPESGRAFNDSKNYQSYLKRGGNLQVGDWRRQNINQMVADIYKTVKSIKPAVEVGISPFGIWRSGYPEGVHGLSQYDELYADPVLWASKGWCDYMSPQLYWAIGSKQPFERLLPWWAAQMKHGVKLVPGLAAYRISEDGWPASEITRQIKMCNSTRGVDGYALFSIKELSRNSGGLATALKK